MSAKNKKQKAHGHAIQNHKIQPKSKSYILKSKSYVQLHRVARKMTCGLQP